MAQFYFDKEDKAILSLVNRILESGEDTKDRLLNPNLHPHGIKELVASPVERMAYAVIYLLRNLDDDQANSQAEDRLVALQALYDEVLNSAHSTLRRNTARVLMQIMKDMVRAHGQRLTQMKLAHDFRSVVHGTPRIVRRMLYRYYLPELPENWNQLAFDDHVYDANSKGRKTPTHLIMDAWIKGLRSLTVAYEYCLDTAVVRELLRAAEITGITVRIGLEFQTIFHDHIITLFWIPRGFSSNDDFLEFLKGQEVTDLMAKGREVLAWRKQQILDILHIWNKTQRQTLSQTWQQEIPELSEEGFMRFLGRGQPSLLRLAEYLHRHLLPFMRTRAAELLQSSDAVAKLELADLNNLGPDFILDEWFSPKLHPEMPDLKNPDSLRNSPSLMQMSPKELSHLLTTIPSGYRLVLGTIGLSLEDVTELLWDCQGAITHLEIFNMKGWVENNMKDMAAIGELQRALTLGLGPHVKQMVRQMIHNLEDNGEEVRANKFREILRDLPTLWEHYRHTPLKSRLGTSSDGRYSFGMGLIVRETLPRRALSEAIRRRIMNKPIPIRARIEEQIIFRAPEQPSLWQKIGRRLSFLPGCRHLGLERSLVWKSPSDEFRVTPNGNVENLGGMTVFQGNGLLENSKNRSDAKPGSLYLNSSVANWLKVLLGFIPAFFSFYFTQDWWLLAWFGAFIWFGITGIRNVLQMVMADRGASRGTLVHWTKQVSIPRLCDSLMYTGISVLLLEVLVRVLFLEDLCGISVTEQPLLVYTVLNCVNALYIFAHNVYRGFPREAAIGNIFRSALSIPVASLYDFGLTQLLFLCGANNPAQYLAPSAAIISKLASDTVAAIIEGYADSQVNLRMRNWDFESKLKSVFSCYTRLELLFPQEDALIKLARPGGLGTAQNAQVQELERTFIIDALDLMYLWYYQPRAQEAFRQLLRTLPDADRMVLMRAQLVLTREREISQLLVDGLLGRKFSRPLAFFLDKHTQYVRLFIKLCRQVKNHEISRSSSCVS